MVYQKMGVKMMAPTHAGAIWRERLASALRTALACTIIGCTALYGPEPVRLQIQYPSVAYVTAILIVSDATLGTTLRGSFYALCATLLVLPSSILCLLAVGTSRFTEVGAAAAVALSAFLVALPEFLPILAKRIAFVQLVIIYVGTVVRGSSAGAVAHPVHIAACTALGASASVLALVLPYPRLAISEVKKQFQLYTENASQRSGLYMKAFLSEDKEIANDLISRCQPMAESGAKLLDHINHIQEGVKWERSRMEDRLDNMETPIKGMELALDSIPSFPTDIVSPELRTVLQSERVHQTLKLNQAKCFVSFDEAVTVPERKDDLFDKSLHTLTNVPPTHRNLPAFFFLSCLELLVSNSSMNPKQEPEAKSESESNQEVVVEHESRSRNWNRDVLSKQRIVFALKCSISLGLAVLLGMYFDKKNGYWSGLTIAISFVEGRQPVFTVANARVQGTAIGTVYGVLGSCLLNQVAEIRFIILLPWIVFTSLSQHSRMLGESGGISAVIGALLILGRKNYGPVKEFAIARITEVSIGLFCMVVLEVVLEPVRAATLVKRQVSKCLGTVDDCLNKISNLNFLLVKEHINRLKSDINQLKSLSRDAKLEPSFWILPFRANCYDRMQRSLSKTVDLMQIMMYNIEFILSNESDEGKKELQEHITQTLEMLKGNGIKRLQTIMSMKSIEELEHKLQEKERIVDLESGTPIPGSMESTANDIDAFLQYSKEVTDKILGNKDRKERTILHLNSLIFGVYRLMKETKEVEKCIKEIIRWENPSRQIDFRDK